MKQNKRVYISGPMTDPKTGRISEANLMAFRVAEELLRDERRYVIKNPTRVWMCRLPRLYRWLEKIVGHTTAYGLVLLYDVLVMLRCDIIYKIPGWTESKGAQIESCVAFHFGLWVLPKKQRDRLDLKIAKRMEKFNGTSVNPEGLIEVI